MQTNSNNNKNIINPDAICQNALNAKMEVYKAKEYFESILKAYNERTEDLISVVSLMKKKIFELEEQIKNNKGK